MLVLLGVRHTGTQSRAGLRLAPSRHLPLSATTLDFNLVSGALGGISSFIKL